MDENIYGYSCYAVVLAGGSGARLWPLSRALFPKQLIAFENEFSLLQLTLKRLLPIFGAKHIHIITGEDHVFEVRRQAMALDAHLEAGVLAEPVGRNTLPAMFLGLDRVLRTDNDAAGQSLVAMFPCDHYITGEKTFAENVRQALSLAAKGHMVTFGIVPHSPQTGFGYVRRGDQIEKGISVVLEFTEKPDREQAELFLRGGKHFWNSGMFVFPGTQLIKTLHDFQPEFARWWDGRANGGAALLENYSALPSLSIDYGIMEHASDVVVVEAGFGWDDLGSWEALHRVADKDEYGCSIQGDVLSIDCKDSLLFSRWGKLVAVGLDNIVAVQTSDATLVCHREQTQRVKDVVDHLKTENSPLTVAHLAVRRPWGSYTILDEAPGYKVKRISVDPGGMLSLQMHNHRAEHWVVAQGTAQVTLGEENLLLSEREWVSIPCRTKHRLHNPGTVQLELIEVQSGAYLEEDDIIRFEDKYGR
jgi:mannose-1-phosphate guanylyltransferase/mannose-6-phosphate isomerase